MNAISINNHELGIKEYCGQRVVTLGDIDNVHQRPKGTARRSFNTHKKRFIENEDYFFLNSQTNEIRTFGINSPRGAYVVTETGYLMLVKSFTDDLAWEVQRKLVKSYFRGRALEQTAPVPSTDDLTPKFFDGKPVMTVRDVEAFSGISAFNIKYHIKSDYDIVEGVDYQLIKGAELQKFKRENRGSSAMAKSLYVLVRSGVEKIIMHAPNYSKEMTVLVQAYFGTPINQDNPLPKIGDGTNTMFVDCFNGDLNKVFGYIAFLNEELREAQRSKEDITELIGEKGMPRSTRIQLLMKYVDHQKCKILDGKKAYNTFSAGEAYGAIQFAQCIGDISPEKARKLEDDVYKLFLSIDQDGNLKK